MIVARYLARETLTTLTAVLGVLLLIFISQQFVRFLGSAMNGGIGHDMVLSMLGLQVPVMLSLLLPLAFFLGVLLAAGRLYVDSEMVVLRACGFSEWQFLRWLSGLFVVVVLAAAAISYVIGPWAVSRQLALTEAYYARGDTAQLAPGRFQEIAGGKRVIYTETYDRNRQMQRVFIADLPPVGKNPDGTEPPLNVVVAKTGALTSDPAGNDYLELHDGQRYEGVPGQLDFTVTDYQNYRTLLQTRPSDTVNRKLKAYSPTELSALPPSREVMAEWQWRLSTPVSTVLLGILALPLARTNPRQGRYAGVLPAIGLYLGYMLLLMAGRNALESGKLPALAGLWPIHALVAVLALWLVVRGSGLPWRLNKGGVA